MVNTRLSSSILPKALGELELSILATLWDLPQQNAKEIANNLQQADRHFKLSTVQSSLESLRSKGLVDYKKQRQAFVYTATVSRSDLLGRFVSDVIQTLHDGKLDTILSSFVYVASNIHDNALDDLEKLIKKKRQEAELENKQKNNRDST